MLTSRRALCPRCGAPLTLESGSPVVSCDFCACRVVVERRLRTAEPDPGDPDSLRRMEWEEVTAALHCSGCGTALDYDESQPLVRCPSCLTETRWERRLRRLLSSPDNDEPDVPATVALIRKVVHEAEMAERVLAAVSLLDWHQMGPTLGRHMPEVMAAIQGSDARLGFPLSRVVGRALCTDDRFLHDCVLEAATEVVFRVDGCRALLFELGMGPGTGFRLLLDVAQWACQQGAVEYGCTALWGAGSILQRHYEEHEVLRQVLLYRVLYLDGPVLGWAVQMITSQQGVAMRYPPDMLLKFLDEAAEERPEVASALAAHWREGPAADQVEYKARLERLAALRTPLARQTALRMLQAPPEGSSLRLLRQASDLLLPWLDEEALVPAVVEALRSLCDSPAGVPQALHDLVRQRGDALPEDVRRLYLDRVPDSPHLSPLPVRYWRSSSPEDPLQAEIAAWRQGISAAVDAYHRQEAWADDYRRRLAERTPLMAAATRGDEERVRALLDQGANPEEVNPNGWTALMFAAEAGRATVVRLLLERGASATHRDEQQRNALLVAAEAGHRLVLDTLRTAVGESEIQQVFRTAFQKERWATMDWALEHGADPDTLDEEGRTPLILAVLQGDRSLVGRLLSAGSTVDHTDRHGRSACSYASLAGDAVMIELLLAAGAEPIG